jgi:hypothetical protein
MDIKLNLPFSIKGGSKKTFKILKEEELNKLSEKKGKGILNFIKKMIIDKKENEKIHKKESNHKKNSILYTKGSNTKEYYQKINKKLSK